MNTGIGDVVNLAWKLSAVLRGNDSSLLDSFEPERIAFARRLVATTDRAFAAVTSRGSIAWRLWTRLVPLIAPLLFRVPALRRLMFRTVSQIGVDYSGGPLSEGKPGDIHAGDRLPWAGDEDNFAPLTSLAWQVHVYVEPESGLIQACAKLGLSLHHFAWKPEMGRGGLTEGTSYLIRPDGYVARADIEGLERYFQSRGLLTSLAASKRPAS
jgi:hypothetical protein